MTATVNILSRVPDTDTIGGRIRRAREATGYSSAQLARRIGVKTTTVAGWEHDRAAPRTNRLTMLAGVLGVSPTWLLHGLGEAPAREAIRGELAVLSSSLEAVKELHRRSGEAIARLEEQIARLS